MPSPFFVPSVVRSATGYPLSVDPSAWLAGVVVVDVAGLAPAIVRECGHRLCPHCAPRASARNRRRLLERMDVAGRMSVRADDVALADDAFAELERVRGSSAFLASHFGDLWAPSGARRAFADDAEWHRLCAFRRVENWRRESRHACGLEVDPGEPLPMPERPTPRALAASTLRADVLRQLRRAHRAVGAALERERAAVLLSRVERGGWPARFADAVELGEALAGAVAREEWRKVHGPVFWSDRRDRARFAGVARRAAEGEGRALQTLTRLHDQASAQLLGVARQVLEAGGEASWTAARDLWLERERLALIAREAAARARLWRDGDVVFVTLTHRDRVGESCGAAVGRLRRALSRLQRSEVWRSTVAGGVIRIEVERSSPATRAAAGARKREHAAMIRSAAVDVDDVTAAELRRQAAALVEEADRLSRRVGSSRGRRSSSSTWHAHAHLAVSVGWADQRRWWDAWSRAAAAEEWRAELESFGPTHGAGRFAGARARSPAPAGWFERVRLPRGSVNIKLPERGAKGVAAELTKYVTKPAALGDLTSSELADLTAGLKGVRTLRVVGALFGLKLEQEERSSDDVKEGATLSEAMQDETIPVGYVVRDGIDGPERVPLSILDIVWREDAGAAEARRRTLAARWELQQSRRGRHEV